MKYTLRSLLLAATLASPLFAADGLSVRLTLEKIELGHIHDFDFAGVRSSAGKPLLHTKAYYTVNEIPLR